MKKSSATPIREIACEKSYYLPNTNIRIDEINPQEIERLWEKLNKMYSFL